MDYNEAVAGLLNDGVLADAISIFPRPMIPPINLKEGKGFAKKVRKQVTEKTFTSKLEKWFPLWGERAHS